MIKLEKTTKTNLKAKNLQIVDGNIADSETGEVINLINIISNTFDDEYFDFTFTTSTKEESEVDTGEIEESEAEEY